jgi:hypothetical protein
MRNGTAVYFDRVLQYVYGIFTLFPCGMYSNMMERVERVGEEFQLLWMEE